MAVGSVLDAGGAGRDLVAADVAIGAGWGGTATKAVVAGSNRSRGRINVTASATTPAQATATVTITFPEPFDTPPFVVASRDMTDEGANGDLVTNDVYVDSVTETEVVIQSAIIPVAAKVTGISYVCVG